MKTVYDLVVVKMKISRIIFFCSIIIFCASLLLSSCRMDHDPLMVSSEKNGVNGNILKTGSLVGAPTLYYGHEKFVRNTGGPVTIKKKIGSDDLINFESNFVVKIQNGDGQKNLISSAIIKINGNQIFGPSEFSNKVAVLTKEIAGLTSGSELEVELRSGPGGYIDLWIEGTLKTGHALFTPAGGIITLANSNIKIDLPPGAVDQPVYISVTNISDEIPGDLKPTDNMQYELLPHGLLFNHPVTLSLPYQSDPNKVHPCFAAFIESNGIWELLKILNVDPLSKIAQINVPHFSTLILQNQDLQLVVDVPGKYLKKGDIIYSLTSSGGFNWFPGHTGLYLGTDDAMSYNNDGDKIIESDQAFGVHYSTLSDFVNRPDQLYMGARRFIGNTTNLERQLISGYAMNQSGKPWKSIVDPSPAPDAVSCVGLTETAYETAGKDLVPSDVETPVFYPQSQYLRTKPIDEIILRSGEEISLKVYAVIWDTLNQYSKTSENVAVSTLPIGSTFTKSGDYWIFKWTPSQNQEGSMFDIVFTVSGIDGDKNQTISFLVVGAIDIEGNIYHTVNIGTQVWLVENLKTAKYRNGDLIGTTDLDTKGQISAAYQWAYNGTESNVPIYGRLYSWATIIDSRGLCPDGWHVPSKTEWVSLATYLGDLPDYLPGGPLSKYSTAGGKLKETGTDHWLYPNSGATNETGFTALPAGYHEFEGPSSELIGEITYWWSSTLDAGESRPYSYECDYNFTWLHQYKAPREYGFSVRCIKN